MTEYSIIIPVRNGVGQIENCLQSLFSIAYPRDQFEILVVDNRSEDGTADCITGKFPSVRLVSEDTVVSSYSARNLGAQHASGEWLLFVDADCIADTRILQEYANYLKQVQALAGGVRFRFTDPKNPFEIYDSQRWLQQKRSATKQNFGCTANMLVRRDIFFKAGQFPVGVYSGGDSYFGRQLEGIGIRVGYAESAFVYHPTRKTLRELTAKASRLGMGNHQLFGCLHCTSYRQDSLGMLKPRLGRIWRMKKSVHGGLRLYLQLLWIDWNVNCAMRSGYRTGRPSE